MSDKIDELKRSYRRNVVGEKARTVGLCTIPEYPEYQRKPGMWATALDVILTTLRYLAPATLLTIFWGHQSFLFKLLKYVDSAFRSIVYSSEEQKQSVLQWLEHAGTVRVDKLETVWRHGWLICGVLDRALPGACAGHPPTKLSLKHAQSIAENYLGVEPIFTSQELESIETLGKHQEWKLITFLDNIRLSLAKLAPPSTKIDAKSFGTESVHHTFDYIAKGSGLTAAQINNKAHFNIYPTAHQSSDPGDINIEIIGPKNAQGTITIPAILGKAQMIRQSLLGKRSTTNYTESILPITQGTTYLRTYGKNDMSKTYFIPTPKSNIEIESEVNDGHVNIGYTVELEGKYEISITSRNLNIAGSPFIMAASKNIVEILEKDNFCLEDGEEIDIVDVTTDRKVVLRIVDFGTEKMLLKENGTLEKISEEEAKHLMESDIVKDSENSIKQTEQIFSDDEQVPDEIFKTNSEENEYTKCKGKPQEYHINDIIRHKTDIPDVVNSTFNDYNVKGDSMVNKPDKYIVPENISVSLTTEKRNIQNTPNVDDTHDKLQDLNFSLIQGKLFNEENLSEESLISSNNQNCNDTHCDSLSTEKKFGSFIKSEYETNNSQNEEMQNTSTKVVLKDNVELNKYCTFSGVCNNDLVSHCNIDNTNISDINNVSFTRCDEPQVFTKNYKDNNNFNNQTHFTDFKIGAPVSIVPEKLCDKREIIENEISDLKVNTNVTKTDKYKESNEINIWNKSPNKDMWDSAYVSIDETNSCDVIINEDINDSNNKQKHSNIDLIPNLSDSQHLDKLNSSQKHKQDPKTLVFKSIQEEIVQKKKVSQKPNHIQDNDTDSVTEALAHLDDIYDDYFLSKDVKQIPNQNNERNLIIKHTIECDVHVDSASENKSDVKRHIVKTEGKISEVQAMVTESDSASQILHTSVKVSNENTETQLFDEIQYGDKTFSNIVTRRKVYWDEKIRQNESKAEELKSFSKRRLSSKYLRRNDSLTKRRGKKIVQNYLNSNKLDESYDSQFSQYNKCDSSINKAPAETQNKIKLKDSFMNCWDNRVNSMNSIDSCFGKKTTKNKVNYIPCENPSLKNKSITNRNENCSLDTALQMKQELSEKVFEAFETSPKRFFGTSRQQILNKIDTFIERSDVDDAEIKNNINDIRYDSGLVSSRISLFHSITKTEPLSTSHRKHKSLHNISSEKVSIDKNFILKGNQKSFNDDNEKNSIQIGKKFNIDQNANLIKEPIVSFQVEKKDVCEVPRNDCVDTCKKMIMDSNIDIPFNPSILNQTESLENITEDFDKHLLTSNKLKNLSKSEMDIFNKTSTIINIDIEKHKSYEELPNISVKKFISIYEDVSKTAIKEYGRTHKRFQDNSQSESSTGGTSKGMSIETLKQTDAEDDICSKNHAETNRRLQNELINSIDKHASCLSLSDFEIEIIDKPDSISEHETDTKEEYVNYKNRFILAKQYFKSLEDVRIESKPKINKENMILNDTNESLDNNNNKKQKRNNVKKSRSMPSSEISKIWDQMQNQPSDTDNTKKLMKISEKFNVEDLYEDVMDGRLSRQGSLRGIPNKKAVLETFRSMDNVNGKKFNSYEFAKSHTSEFKIENEIRNAQTYLSEYPYLPTTDPSKYHSRFDASACGLITFKELKQMKNVRRNSVPESTIDPIVSDKH